MDAVYKHFDLFQSTRPHGARPRTRAPFSMIFVSIHAPARGATNSLYVTPYFQSFNPRARTGRDKFLMMTFASPMFQSTRPHGARPDYMYRLILLLVSIHAPARGATDIRSVIVSDACFNPRARTGRDLQEAFHDNRLWVSIHAPARGATSGNLRAWALICFNPRARTGRDHQKVV